MDEQHEGCDEDPDFIESDHDFEPEEDDAEYDRNVTEGIEIGSYVRQDKGHEQREDGNDNNLDELELPSSKELLSQCSSDEEGSYNYPEFNFNEDMKNPQFKVGQIFSSDNDQTFHFIPTPMLYREVRSCGQQSGPSATFSSQ